LEEQLDLMKKKLPEYPIYEQGRYQQGTEGAGRREEGARRKAEAAGEEEGRKLQETWEEQVVG
jgi:hypothetical protein